MQIQPNSTSKRRVSYFYNSEISKYTYSKEHPMKPQRIAMAHNLIINYNLFRELDVYTSRQATKEELKKFHSSDYIDYLERYIAKNLSNSLAFEKDYFDQNLMNQDQNDDIEKKQKYKVGLSTDCPGFSGLFNFCQLSSGASIGCSAAIINNQSDISINWGGGLHHAKKCQASGFCYTNDIVLCILQLLEVYPRVLYIDIDVHHGDGVQEAFYLTNRVMTVSFHQYTQNFFPGTGSIDSVGYSAGKYYSLNVPLKVGIDDESYFQIFTSVIKQVMQKYRPYVIVMQLGADSLAYDKLGQFNLSVKGHGACLKYMLGFGTPLIMLGGGGYTIQNVARCWAYQTGVALGIQLSNQIPNTDIFYQKYGFDQKLHFPIPQVQNKNKPQDLNKMKQKIHEYLQQLEIAPGVQLHSVPVFSEWQSYLQQESTEYGNERQR